MRKPTLKSLLPAMAAASLLLAAGLPTTATADPPRYDPRSGYDAPRRHNDWRPDRGDYRRHEERRSDRFDRRHHDGWAGDYRRYDPPAYRHPYRPFREPWRHDHYRYYDADDYLGALLLGGFLGYVLTE